MINKIKEYYNNILLNGTFVTRSLLVVAQILVTITVQIIALRLFAIYIWQGVFGLNPIAFHVLCIISYIFFIYKDCKNKSYR